jgi:hypothetical protein
MSAVTVETKRSTTTWVLNGVYDSITRSVLGRASGSSGPLILALSFEDQTKKGT